MIVLRALALAALLFVPGWLAFSLLRAGGKRLDGGERLFLATSLGTGTVSLCAMLLALASAYSLAALLILVGSLCAVLALAARKGVTWIKDIGIKDILVALAFVAVALVVFLPPWRIVFGWSDVGAYANIATQIEQEGSITIHDRTVTEVSEGRRDLLYYREQDRTQSDTYFSSQFFLIDDFEGGTVRPWFYYLWPSLMAVFASFLGFSGQFYAITVISFMALWGFYLLAARLLGARWAVAAAALFTLSPLMLYLSHYTMSEMMNMLLFLSGSLCLLAYPRAGRGGGGRGLAVLSALFFTLGFLCRIDFIFILVPLGACYLAKRISGGITAEDCLFLGLISLGAALAVIMGFMFSQTYFRSIWRSFFGSLDWLFSPLGLALALALLGSFAFGNRLAGTAQRLREARALWVPALWLALGGTFIFLYFIRPLGTDAIVGYGFIKEAQGPSYMSENLVRWGWYLSFAGLLAAFAGYGVWFTRRRGFGEYALGLTGLAFTLLYAWDMRAMPMHILAMRRLLPVVFPMAVMAVAYALKGLVDGAELLRARGKTVWFVRISRVLALAALLYLAVFSVNASLPIFGLDESGNQVEICESVASDIPAGATLIMDYHLGDLFGSPLKCMHGVENAWLKDNAVLGEDEFLLLLRDLGFAEKPVYLLWRPGQSGEQPPLAGSLRAETVGTYRFEEESLEKTFDRRPEKRAQYNEGIVLYRLRAEGADAALPDARMAYRGS